jgi:hypothetical protein
MAMKERNLQSLTVADLQQNPVWEYESKFDNLEVWELTEIVRPTKRKEISENDTKTYICLTEFSLGDGTEYIGFCSPQDDSSLEYASPVIIHQNDHIELFSSETAWNKNGSSKKLGKVRNQVFPINVKCSIPCDGKYYFHVIENFPMPDVQVVEGFNFIEWDCKLQGTFWLRRFDENALEAWCHIDGRQLFFQAKNGEWRLTVTEKFLKKEELLKIKKGFIRSGKYSTKDLITPGEARDIIRRCGREFLFL